MDPVGLAYPSQIEGEITRRIAELVRVVDLEKATVRTLQRELELRLGRDLSDHRGFIRTQVENALKLKATETKRSAGAVDDYKPSKPQKKKPGVRGKTKDVVDPTKPKGPKGPFMCFVGVRRSQIKQEKPNATFSEISTQLGLEWKTMSERERATYEAMAEAEKARYHREMQNYVPLSEEKMEELREQQRIRKAAGGLQVMYKCSPQLENFLGGVKEINREKLTRTIWAYFREKQLMDPINKRYVVPDAKLAELLGMQPGERFLAFAVSKYLTPHLIRKQ